MGFTLADFRFTFACALALAKCSCKAANALSGAARRSRRTSDADRESKGEV